MYDFIIDKSQVNYVPDTDKIINNICRTQLDNIMIRSTGYCHI